MHACTYSFIHDVSPSRNSPGGVEIAPRWSSEKTACCPIFLHRISITLDASSSKKTANSVGASKIWILGTRKELAAK